MSVLLGLLMNFLVDVFGKLFLHAAFKIVITLHLGVYFADCCGHCCLCSSLWRHR